jgi:hypothetical protein
MNKNQGVERSQMPVEQRTDSPLQQESGGSLICKNTLFFGFFHHPIANKSRNIYLSTNFLVIRKTA